MKLKVTFLALVFAVAAVWVLAYSWPKHPVPLPETYRGDWFVVAERVTNEGEDVAALPPGQERYFIFREDGTYHLTIRLPGGGEMLRREGLVSYDDGELTMQLVSENRRATPAPPDRFRIRWETVEGAQHLVLAHDGPSGYEIHLKRATPKQ